MMPRTTDTEMIITMKSGTILSPVGKPSGAKALDFEISECRS
jgi:hypothetical protein